MTKRSKYTRMRRRQEWAEINMNLGPLYRRRVREDRRHDLERSISASLAALGVFEQLKEMDRVADIQLNLGIAYRERIEGNQEDNIAEAIAHLEAARDISGQRSRPLIWVKIMSSLGNALRAQPNKEDDEDLTSAIEVFQEALAATNKDEMPNEWSDLQINLASCFEMLRKGDHGSHLVNAIARYESVLQIISPSTRPVECLKVAARLGELQSASGQWEKAVNAYRIALIAGQQLYSSSVVPTGRESELVEIGELHHRAAFAVARSGDFTDAIVVLEQGRARAMAEAYDLDPSGLGKTFLEADQESLEALRHASQHLRELESAEQMLETLMSGELIDQFITQQKLDPEQQAHARRLAQSGLHQDIRNARAAVREAHERLSHGSGHNGETQASELAMICEAVVDGAPLAYLTTTTYGTVILLAYRSSNGQPQADAIWADTFDDTKLASLLSPGSKWPPVSGLLPAILEQPILLRDALDTLLPVVGQEIATPLAERLTEIGATQVTLIPCGSLGFIPFHAAIYRSRTGQHFNDSFEVTYAPSARTLEMARRMLATKIESAPRLVGVGDPRPISHPLPFAHWELSQIANLFERRVTFCGDEAKKEPLFTSSGSFTYSLGVSWPLHLWVAERFISGAC